MLQGEESDLEMTVRRGWGGRKSAEVWGVVDFGENGDGARGNKRCFDQVCVSVSMQYILFR